MKLLILGSQGNLGGQIKKVFEADTKYEITAWDRDDIDVANFLELKEKILSLRPEIIINTVAYNAVDKCEEDERELELAKKLNGEVVGDLSDLALELGSVLVHYSTDYVFSGDKEVGYIEIDEPQPINNYGRSKLLGEQELLKRESQGLKYYLIRTSKLFGPKGLSSFSKPSFFDIMLNMAKEGKEIMAVNEETSCFTYTPDLALETKKLVDFPEAFGIYHIINPGAKTWYQAALLLFQVTGQDVVVKEVGSGEWPRPALRPKYSRLLNTKLKPLRDLKQALEDYLLK